MRRKTDQLPAYPIQAVEHALVLLELFSQRHRLSVTEAAKALGVAASTASRLVAMLRHHGYVEIEQGSRAYVVGNKFRELGVAVVRELDIRPQIRPYLETLAAETGETIQAGTLQGQHVIFLDCVEGYRSLRVSSTVGAILPAHCLSTGKALLAELSRDDLLTLYPREELQRVTKRSIGTRTQLLRHLAIVQKQGFATAFSESDMDIATVAVAVKDVVGRVRCAIGFAAPSSRLREGNVKPLAAILRRSATAIGSSLF